MRLGERQQQFSRFLTRLMLRAFELGYEIRMGEVQRTVEQQKLYFTSGKSKTMNSLHLDKCAADLHFFLNGELCYPKELGDLWESYHPGCKWGGNWKSFKDAPHFEFRG